MPREIKHMNRIRKFDPFEVEKISFLSRKIVEDMEFKTNFLKHMSQRILYRFNDVLIKFTKYLIM